MMIPIPRILSPSQTNSAIFNCMKYPKRSLQHIDLACLPLLSIMSTNLFHKYRLAKLPDNFAAAVSRFSAPFLDNISQLYLPGRLNNLGKTKNIYSAPFYPTLKDG